MFRSAGSRNSRHLESPNRLPALLELLTLVAQNRFGWCGRPPLLATSSEELASSFSEPAAGLDFRSARRAFTRLLEMAQGGQRHGHVEFGRRLSRGLSSRDEIGNELG